MKKIILFLILALGIQNAIYATVFIYKTNNGTLKYNDKLQRVTFNNITYSVANVEKQNESTYLYCSNHKIQKAFMINTVKGKIAEFDYIEVFKLGTIGKYDKKELIRNAYLGVDEFINTHIRRKYIHLFRNAVQYMLEGIDKGTITMDNMGNFQDKMGKAHSTGKMSRKKKDRESNAYGMAAAYIYEVITQMPECNEWKLIGNPYIILKTSKLE